MLVVAAHPWLRSLAVATVTTGAVVAQSWHAVDADSLRGPACVAVTETGGTELVIVDGKVHRRRGNVRLELEATYGAVQDAHTLAPSPGGATYVAARNGVFLTHPEVATIDRCEFGTGAPTDEVVGIVCDRIDRVWLATRTELLVVHHSLGFHRRHGRAESLPAPPFLGLDITGDGELRLRHAHGVHGYHPDPTAPPAPRATLGALGPDCTIRLRLHQEGGDDTVEHRYRERSHHMLRPAAGDVDLRKPGRHDLLVYAFDRDLDRSPPCELSVTVPFPSGFDARFAAALGAGLGLLVGVLLAWHARHRGHAWPRTLLDGALTVAVSLQLAMAMTGVGRTYPFLGFTMYDEVYREHDVLFTPELVARTELGTRVQNAGTLAFATDGVWRHVTSLAFADASTQRSFVQRLGADVDTLELRIRRCRLTAAGPRDIAPFVLARLERGPR